MWGVSIRMTLWDSRVVTNEKQRCSRPHDPSAKFHAFGERFPARVPGTLLAMSSAAAKSNKLGTARVSNNGRMD